MDRLSAVANTDVESLYRELHVLRERLGHAMATQFDRSLPFADEVFDRWERARQLGFGEGSSIYDNALVFGRPRVGVGVWIGPNTILDATGGLTIGDHCTIAVGAQIYTHDNVRRTLTGGAAPLEHSPVDIGSCTYVGPNVVVRRGVHIGAHAVIGVGTYVSHDVPDHAIVAGTPAQIIGQVCIDAETVRFEYHAKSQRGAE